MNTATGKPILLDLFCGEGGAAKGYTDAGFEVYGIDNDKNRLSNYYAQYSRLDDVIEVMNGLASGGEVEFFDNFGSTRRLTIADISAIHASPPCTGYSAGTRSISDRLTRYDRLIAATRSLLVRSGLPYVIENVAGAGAELINPIKLCWSMFNEPGCVLDSDGTPLRMERHRLFESNARLVPPRDECRHPRSIQVAGAYGGARRDAWEARNVRRGGYVPPNLMVLRKLTGLGWASEKGCFLSIPPAYTEFIGRQLIDHILGEKNG